MKAEKKEAPEMKVFVKYMNKEKGFKNDVKFFESYEKAVAWCKENFEKFDPDMINYI